MYDKTIISAKSYKHMHNSYNPQEQSAYPSFDEQFERGIKVYTLGVEADAVDLVPENLTSETPVLVAQGWGQMLLSMKPMLKMFFESGRRVMCIEHPRHGGDLGRVDVAADFPPEIRAEVWKAYNLAAMIKDRGILPVDVAGVSEGGLNCVLAAIMEPELIRNMALVGPAGLMGKTNFWDVSFRFVRSLLREHIDMFRPGAYSQNKSNSVTETWNFFGQNPYRALTETAAIAATQTQEMIRALHRGGHRIAVTMGVDDLIFDVPRTAKILATIGDDFDGFYITDGGHYDTVNNPKMGAIIRDLLGVLAAMPALKKDPTHVQGISSEEDARESVEGSAPGSPREDH